MISASALRAFLDRSLDSFDWIKECSEVDLDKALAELAPVPRFHLPPFKHQKACFLIGLSLPEFLYLLDLGLGKTKLVLDLISYRKLCGEKPKALVLVPNVANIENWVIEIEIHAPKLSYVALEGSSLDKTEWLKEDADLYITNYAGLVAMVSESIPHGKKHKWVVRKEKLQRVIDRINSVAFDESTEFKNHLSLAYQACRDISAACYIRYALTGIPFGRNPHDLWSQFYVIDQGLTLGPTLGLFREAFFTKKRNFFGGPYSFDYKFDKDKERRFHEVIKNRSIYYDEDECPDLPEKVFSKRFLTFPVDTYQYYKKVVESLRDRKHNMILVKNSFLQMRQLASGFLGYKEDVGGKTAKIVFADNPKLDELMRLVDELPPRKKMIIFHEYIFTGEVIAKELDKIGIGYARLWSGTKDPGQELRRFREVKSCRILECNNHSGAFGLNLQVANYVVFVESPVSPIVRKNAEKRAHRQGQKAKRVFYYDLVMRNSVDEKILGYLKEGRDLFDALIKGKETLA